MSKPTNNVSRLATIAKMMEDGNWYSSAKVVLAAADEIERLTAERDEARRMYCGRVSRDVPLDAFDIAKNHGWGCFPQEDESCQ
jgi:hypothetical protein